MKTLKILSTALAGIILLSGCSSANEINITPLTELSPTSSSSTSSSIPTITPSPMPSPTLDVYTYSKERLFNAIPSYEYFLANPEKVAWAPYDPWTQPEKMMEWIHGDFTNDLGDLSKLEANVIMVSGGEIPGSLHGTTLGAGIYAEPYQGKQISFGVRHNGESYFVACVTVKSPEGGPRGTHCILLFTGKSSENMNRSGLDAIKLMYEGVRKVSDFSMWKGVSPDLPEELNSFQSQGYDAFANGYSYPEWSVEFGLGSIDFFD